MIDIRKLPNLNNEQKEFVDEFYKLFLFDNSLIANVEPVLYEGLSNGLNFQVYNAQRLWLMFDMVFVFSVGVDVAPGTVTFYDQGNNIFLYDQNLDIGFDSVAPTHVYQKNDIHLKNIWFSRFLDAQYNYVKAIGYQITLV